MGSRMLTTIVPPDRPVEVHGPEEVVECQLRKRRYESVRLEDGVKEYLDCWGYKSVISKTVLYHFLGVFTLGLGYLILSWKPSWSIAVRKVICDMRDADSMLLKDAHGSFFSKKIHEKVLTRKPKFLSADLTEFGLLKSQSCDHSLNPSKSAKNFSIELLGKTDPQRPSVVNEPICSAEQPPKLYTVRYFVHQHAQYVWNNTQEQFQRLSGVPSGISCANLSTHRPGLSDEERRQKLCLFGPNVIDVEVKSILSVLTEEVLNPFYCFQVFCIVLWSLDDYYIYASCVLLVSLFGIILSLYETRKQRIRLRDMVQESTSKEQFSVLDCNGDFAERLPEHLVPGDIIQILKGGCLMPCDAALIEGNCVVNEAVLTGESAPVTKVPLSGVDTDTFSDEHKRHILFHGTKVIQTRCLEGPHVLAVVCQTGFSTVKGDLVRTILFPKPVGFKFYRDAIRFVGVMAIMAAIGMMYSVFIYVQHGESLSRIIIRALDLVTIVVPPALPAALTVGIVYSQRRLKKVGIFCISPSRINACGKIKLVCFDKTGTLTEDGLDLMGVVPVVDGDLGKIVTDLTELEPYDPVLVGMASCHSLTMVGGKLTGDPLDIKLFEATDWIFSEPQDLAEKSALFGALAPTIVCPDHTNLVDGCELYDHPALVQFGIARQFPFSSGLQRMSVVTKASDSDSFCVFVKGSPEKIMCLSKPESVPLNFRKTLHFYAQQGLRVIAMAYRNLDPEFDYRQISTLKRDVLERDLTFIGLFVMRNNLKPQSPAVIAELMANDIQCVMCTGDNMLTAISVGHECGMIPKGDEVVIVDILPPDDRTNSLAHILWRNGGSCLSSSDTSLAEDDSVSSTPSRAISANEFLLAMERPRYHFALTGRSFYLLLQYFPELVPKVLIRGTIFARFSPDQKTQLVEKYIDLGYITGMVGDGANDCGALKAADAGISLSETEASVASPFTSKQNTIECVPTIIKEGRCALTTSFGIFKYMALYSIVQFLSVLILYQKKTILADAHFLFLDMVITTTVAVLMGYTGPSQHLSRRRPHGSLMSPTTIISIFSQTLVVMGFQTSAIFLLQNQSWYDPVSNYDSDGTEDSEHKINMEATVLFLVAAFQDLILAFVFSKGPPYRKRIYTNVLFSGAMFALVLLTISFLFYVPEFLQTFLKLDYDYTNPRILFRLAVFGLMAANFFAAFAIEEFIVDKIWFKRLLNVIRGKKHSKSFFKVVKRQLDMDHCFPPVGQTTYAKPEDDGASDTLIVKMPVKMSDIRNTPQYAPVPV